MPYLNKIKAYITVVIIAVHSKGKLSVTHH